MTSKAKRLYISSDIEGVAGVTSPQQLGPQGFEYQQARQWMTKEVQAAVTGALSQGYSEVVISDSHGNGQNLLIDEFPEQVQVVRSWPRPLCMMEGIQHGNYNAAMLIGYHGGASDLEGTLAHSFSGSGINEVRLNGKPASETVISAATAAEYGVPTLLVSGDDKYIDHAQEVLPDWVDGHIETVTTKYVCSFLSARMIKPSLVQTRIGEAAERALTNAASATVKPISGSIELDICCQKRFAAELLAYLPIVERLDSHSIRYRCNSMLEVNKFISFILASGSLTPPA